MKKIAVLLSVALVLSLGSAALAADVKVGGEVKYEIKMVGSTNTYTTSWKLNANGSVSDQLGFVVGVKGDIKDGKDKLYPTFEQKGGQDAVLDLDKINFTLKSFGAPFSVTVGLGSVVTGRLNVLETVGLTNFYGFTGINIKTDDLSGFTGQLLLNPANKDAMVTALLLDYKTAFGEFGLNYVPPQSAGDVDKADLAVEAKVPVPNTPVTAYLQYSQVDDSKVVDDSVSYIMAGAQAEFSGVTVYAETNAKEEAKMADSELKTAFGVKGKVFGGEWSVGVESPKKGDSTTKLAYKVSF